MQNANEIFTRYKDQFDKLGARLYASLEWEDNILLRWWFTLQETGDMEKLITPDSRRLPRFLELFASPTGLLYTLTPENEISCASWFTPVDQSATYQAAYSGLYIKNRQSRESYYFTHFAYSLAFEFYSAIIGTTWQPDLLDIHTKLGYKIVGCIPNLYDQPFCYIVHLTKEDFEQSYFARIAQRRT